MENLGERIKRLRSEKGFSQANLHQNQSAVAQIEKGYNSKPKKQTLVQIAKNLEMSFEKLVKDTDWENSSAKQDLDGLAYSQLKFTLDLDEDGTITVTPFSYPAFDANGNKNEYCPETGAPLLVGCRWCERPFLGYDIHCMGCGKKIFINYLTTIQYWLGPKEIAYDVLKNNIKRINELIADLTFEKKWTLEMNYDSSIDPNIIRHQIAGNEYDKKEQLEFLKQYMIEDEMGKYQFDDLDEYLDGLQSSNPDVVAFITEKKFEENFYSALISELKRYRDAIPDSGHIKVRELEEEE